MKQLFTLLGFSLFFALNTINAQVADNTLMKSSHVLDVTEEVYFIVDDMPEFPGGQEELFSFMVKNMDYPINARQKAVTGTVYITFVINKSGQIILPEVLKSVEGYPEFDKEAIRLVSSMPTWKPGIINDEPVNVRYNLPIRFAF